jgi:hypothetical protein
MRTTGPEDVVAGAVVGTVVGVVGAAGVAVAT